MNNDQIDIDHDFRPAGYFWPLDLATHLLATVKGAERRKYIQSLIDGNRLNELNEFFARSSLGTEERASSGRLHPCLMGGEYLPDLLPEEVEIARITLASTTQDVVSVRAERSGDLIYYRVVDEYDGETLNEQDELTMAYPLSLGQLVVFIGDAYSIWDTVHMNELNCDAEQMKSFVSVTSPFYPQIGAYYEQQFEDWAAECPQEEDDEEDVVEAAREGDRHA